MSLSILYKEQEKEAEKLWNQTMRDIQYGDSRDREDWQEIVKKGFIAYTKDLFHSHTITLFTALREAIGEDEKVPYELEPDNYDENGEKIFDAASLRNTIKVLEDGDAAWERSMTNKERARIRSLIDSFLSDIGVTANSNEIGSKLEVDNEVENEISEADKWQSACQHYYDEGVRTEELRIEKWIEERKIEVERTLNSVGYTQALTDLSTFLNNSK